jgi:opacity protein-like surface antigen
MNSLARFLLPMAVLSAAPLAPALAADYEPPIVTQPIQYVPVEVGTGWYLRGDVGYALTTHAGAFDYRTFDPATATYGNGAFDTAKLKSDATFGLGIGYTFNEWFRADVTLDGFRSRFSGTTVSAAPCSGAAVYAGTTCRSEDSAKLSTLSLLANGYVDLGTYAGFTPYVGGGAGVSLVSWNGLDDSTYCVDDLAACPAPDALVASTSHSGKRSYRFTYALMAGLAYDISANLKLDVGYKYTHVNGGDNFGWDDASAAAGATGAQGSDDGFSNQQVRVGLRYELW